MPNDYCMSMHMCWCGRYRVKGYNAEKDVPWHILFTYNSILLVQVEVIDT